MLPVNRLQGTLRYFCAALLACNAFAQVNVLTSNYGPDRTNANLQETQLTVAKVAPGNFGALGVFPVDGEVFGQPLYVSGVTTGGEARNILIITTQHNSVYAYDADRASPPVLLWHVGLGTSVPSTTLSSDIGAYTDVTPEVGILSTGCIDPEASVLYVVSETLLGGTPIFQLHALDLASGAERMNGPVVIKATVPGNGVGSDGKGSLPFDASQHIQRAGLLLANGLVSVAFGSHGDAGLWHGWLMNYKAADLSKPPAVFQVSPSGQGGAIWQSGRGVAADDSGNIYFLTGNGNYDGKQNFAESFVKLNPSTTLTDWYTPLNWQDLSNNDADLSAGPALIPGTHTVVGGDKSGNLYVIDGDSMGHLDNGSTAVVAQAIDGFIFNFALWGRSGGALLYLHAGDGSIESLKIAPGTIDTSPVSTSHNMDGSARIGMAISANGSQDGTGILWVTSGQYHSSTTPGVLHAFDASNLANELWNSEMSPQDSLNGFVKFVSPTVANGKVYAASSRAVVVYGLLPGSTGVLPPPLVAAALNAASYGQDTIAPGELITIFGSNLGPVDGVNLRLDDYGNVATNLSDTQVQFDGIPAAMVYTDANQVSAVVPFELQPGTSQLQLSYQGQTAASYPVTVAAVNPGIFSADSSGTGQALAVNDDGTLNSGDNPAKAGSVIVLYATGAGAMSPSPADGAVVSPDSLPLPILPVTAKIGGVPAEVLYAGGAPGLVAGLLQVNVRVPANTNGGAITIQVGGQSSQAGLTIAVQ